VTERAGATVSRTLDVPREAAALVLADPRTYDGVVVGSRRIRWFDPHWPDPGTTFHHTVGFGPVTVRDHSEVVEEDLPGSLRLLVHVRPLGSAEVVFRLTAEGDRTRAEMTETPVSGILALSWSPPAIALARWRNARVLARLEKVAQGRARSMARGGGPGVTRPGAGTIPGRPATTPDAGRDPDEG
jgi:hypothetical protein